MADLNNAADGAGQPGTEKTASKISSQSPHTNASPVLLSDLDFAARDVTSENSKPLNRRRIKGIDPSLVDQALTELQGLLVQQRSESDRTRRAALAKQAARFLRSPNLGLCDGALFVLTKLGEDAVPALLDDVAQLEPGHSVKAILALGAVAKFLSNEVKSKALAALSSLLTHADQLVADASITALRYLGSSAARNKLQELFISQAPEYRAHLTQELAYFRDLRDLASNADLLVKSRSASGAQELESIPPELSFFLHHSIVADRLADPTWQLIAFKFGYIDQSTFEMFKKNDSVTGAKIALLLGTLGVVGAPLLEALKDPETYEAQITTWLSRISFFYNQLLADELLEHRLAGCLDLSETNGGACDRLLLFAALREADQGNLLAKSEAKPFDWKHEKQLPGRFYFRSQADFLKSFLPQRAQEVRHLLARAGVEAKTGAFLLPYALLQRVALDSETLPEKQKEYFYHYAAKWRAIAKMVRLTDNHVTIYPGLEGKQSADADHKAEHPVSSEQLSALPSLLARLTGSEKRSHWRFGLLEPVYCQSSAEDLRQLAEHPDWSTLSFGARSWLKISAYNLQRQIADDATRRLALLGSKLTECAAAETRFRLGVLSIGAELQNPNIPPELIGCWKQALEFFGVDSPRRPEFGNLVEASTRPTWRPDLLGRIALELQRAGFLVSPTWGVGLHLSLSADLDDQAKYLALGLWCHSTNTPAEKFDEEAWLRAAAPLMSKGLICRNEATLAVDADSQAPKIRTEFRGTHLSGSAEFIATKTAELARYAYALTACCRVEQGGMPPCDGAPQAELAQIWRDYRSAIENIFTTDSTPGADLLAANWYESTGDSRDANLLRELGIVKDLLAWYRHLSTQPGLGSKLAQAACTEFYRFGEAAWKYLAANGTD